MTTRMRVITPTGDAMWLHQQWVVVTPTGRQYVDSEQDARDTARNSHDATIDWYWRSGRKD